jgi:hypothetical protein
VDLASAEDGAAVLLQCVLHRTPLRCAVLRCAVLRCALLRCAALCCAVLAFIPFCARRSLARRFSRLALPCLIMIAIRYAAGLHGLSSTPEGTACARAMLLDVSSLLQTAASAWVDDDVAAAVAELLYRSLELAPDPV